MRVYGQCCGILDIIWEAVNVCGEKNVKAEFALKRSISSGVFEHVFRCTSASAIWQVLDQLFNKTNETRLQLLENELANAKQGESSISEFFIKVKNLCTEINTLNPEESISEVRLKRSIIRGLQPEYTPFVTSVQDWATWRETLPKFLPNCETKANQEREITCPAVRETDRSGWCGSQRKKGCDKCGEGNPTASD
ncbi:hypothetical protein EUTSA_v10019725mg [Eutrema salsugineum]|uniref:Retrotransposon gag domain-containing protein n=1 Tax=Eutrema salsugineum TaxID=72664 RepID=V4KMZ8_EUTSA|nr:hypothetical protein EUTSA_v10019725mg [Eutrema salsugineum]